MKKYLPVVSAFLFLFFSCDYISQPGVPKSSSGWDSVLCPQPSFPFVSVHSKRVLVEDYTGRKCGNCPDASHELDTITQLYGDKVIPLTIHAGYFAKPDTSAPYYYSYDMRSSPGNDYNTFFKIEMLGNPNGMINRVDYDDNSLSHVKPFSSWKSTVSSQLSLSPEADINIITDYKSSSNKLCVHVQSQFLTNLSGSYRLVVLLSEDSLKKPQKDYSLPSPSDDTTYIHRHVLRDAINGTWGENITTAQISSGSIYYSNYTYAVNPGWNASHLYVIAYIYDPLTYRVLQAGQQKIQ